MVLFSIGAYYPNLQYVVITVYRSELLTAEPLQEFVCQKTAVHGVCMIWCLHMYMYTWLLTVTFCYISHWLHPIQYGYLYYGFSLLLHYLYLTAFTVERIRWRHIGLISSVLFTVAESFMSHGKIGWLGAGRELLATSTSRQVSVGGCVGRTPFPLGSIKRVV